MLHTGQPSVGRYALEMPGHAFHFLLLAEQQGRPDFWRASQISAFSEGWALYDEKLGVEMGIYKTPYDNFGRLTYEIWRACRLVIDTGIHSQGWTREQAIEYLRVNTALPEHEIETEVDRYISWPAQALSYKLGEMQIVELRKEAEEKLGPKFNIRSFHDALLGMGVVPLPVMRQQMEKFIQSGASIQCCRLPQRKLRNPRRRNRRSVVAIQIPTLLRSNCNAF